MKCTANIFGYYDQGLQEFCLNVGLREISRALADKVLSENR